MRHERISASSARAENDGLPIFCVCMALFVIGWLKFLLPTLGIYIADYSVRVVICSIILIVAGSAPFHGEIRNPLKAGIAILLAVWITLQIENLIYALTPAMPLLIAWPFPPIDDPVLRWGDAVFGVALVAVSEELVFRFLPNRIGRDRGWQVWKIYLMSALTFAVIHAPQGIVRVLDAAVFSLLAMALFRRFGSLWVSIAVHFLVDFVLFSDVACWANVRTCT